MSVSIFKPWLWANVCEGSNLAVLNNNKILRTKNFQIARPDFKNVGATENSYELKQYYAIIF